MSTTPDEGRSPDSVHHHHHFIHQGGSGSPGSRPAQAPPPPPSRTGYIGRAAGGQIGGNDDDFWRWVVSAFIVAALAACLSLIGWGVYLWVTSDDNDVSGVTIAQILRSQGFEPNYHPICAVEKINDGQAYALALNMHFSCKHTVELTLPREQVQIFHSTAVNYSNATWAFNPNTYDAEGVKQIKSKSLGDQLKVDLRTLVVRLTSAKFQELKSSTSP